jgi:predicted RNA-binding protein with RPS1 domain
MEVEEGIEGLIHVSQLSTDRVDKPQGLFQPGQELEAEVTAVDARDRKIALSIKALRKSEEREEIETYLQKRARGRPLLLRGHPRLGSASRSRRAEPGAAVKAERERRRDQVRSRQ